MKTEKNKSGLGNLIDGDAFRDAVHVAVAPCVAGEDLEPGDHVAFDDGGRAVTWHTGKVGVVDPFLTDPVKEGQKFWLLLYPGTAMNIRHEWDHPSFRMEPTVSGDFSASRMWLQVYAEQHKLTLDDMLAGVSKYVEKGCGDAPILEDDFKEYEVPDVFWTHYKIVTGKTGSGNFWGCCI